MNELYHHGIKGQKWGVRRFQNPDGSLTEAGKKHYYKEDGSLTRAGKRHDINIGKQMDKTFDEKVVNKVVQEMTEYNDKLSNKYKGKNIGGMVSLDGRTFVMATKSGIEYMKEFRDKHRELTINTMKEEYGPTLSNGYEMYNQIYDSMYSLSVYDKNGNLIK